MALDIGLLNVLTSLSLADGAGAALADSIGKAAGDAATKASATISQKLSAGLNKAGKGLTAGVTAPILAIGGAALAAGMEVDGALDAIRIGTGATGETLEQLGRDFEEVAKTTTGSFERTGTVIADLNTRLGLTGEPLQNLAKQLIDLEQITGAPANLDTLTRVLAAFGVPADKATETFDKLFRASQATGVPFDALTTKLVSQSAAFAELGFGLDETAALLAQFEKAGVNTDTVLGALRVNIVKAAKEGKSAAGFFREGVKEIEGYLASGDDASAQARASELFGARTFLDALDAIKRGQFDIDGTLAQLQTGQDTISGLAAETADFPEQLTKLKKTAALALLPIAETLIPTITRVLEAALPVVERFADSFANLSPETQKTIVIVGGLAAALGPVLIVFAKVVSSIGTIVKVLNVLRIALLANPWLLAAAAAIAAVVLIVKYWDEIVAFFSGVFSKIAEYGTAAWQVLTGNLQQSFEAVGRVIGNAISAIANGFSAAGQAIGNVISGVIAGFQAVGSAIGNAISAVAGVLSSIAGAVSATVGAIGGVFARLFSGIVSGFRLAFDLVRERVRAVYDFFRDVFDKIAGFIRRIVDAIRNLPSALAGGVKSLFGGLFGGGRADGGPINANESYLVGERGPELIVPRRAGTVIPNEALMGTLGGAGGANYQITITNPVPEPASTSIPQALRRAAYLKG